MLWSEITKKHGKRFTNKIKKTQYFKKMLIIQLLGNDFYIFEEDFEKARKEIRYKEIWNKKKVIKK